LQLELRLVCNQTYRLAHINYLFGGHTVRYVS
jgi:hypothetical protein